MVRIVVLILFVAFCSCQETGVNTAKVQTAQEQDSLKFFSAIENDSVYFIKYQFYRRVNSNGVINYAYNGNSNDSFVVICDTTRGIFNLIINNKDTSLLFFETYKDYTINGDNYKIIKLVLDKGTTDGEVSYFVSLDFGLLLCRSNTWRVANVLNPEKDGRNYLPMTALLYNVLTDKELLTNQVPKSSIQFTLPKVE